MGLFSFIKDAGEKLFGGKEAQAATAAAPTAAELNTKAAKAIEAYVTSQNLGTQNVQVDYDASQGKVTVIWLSTLVTLATLPQHRVTFSLAACVVASPLTVTLPWLPS